MDRRTGSNRQSAGGLQSLADRLRPEQAFQRLVELAPDASAQPRRMQPVGEDLGRSREPHVRLRIGEAGSDLLPVARLFVGEAGRRGTPPEVPLQGHQGIGRSGGLRGVEFRQERRLVMAFLVRHLGDVRPKSFDEDVIHRVHGRVRICHPPPRRQMLPQTLRLSRG